MVAFHPIIQKWFAERYGKPTDIQALAWPRIALGQHLLLTAFLWALNRFATGDLATGKTRILYISPLKALNNDIRKNLIDPLTELRSLFDAADTPFPDINVATRSGDTAASERSRMLRKPPEILITTPESLNLLLYDIDTLILDEIHAVVDSKRGVYLISAVERLVGMSGEFQRIALSATVNPLALVADFIAGYTRQGEAYEKRQVEVLVSGKSKQYDITIRYPEAAANRGQDENIWDCLASDLLPRIRNNQSTLIFVNSRALCEKLTYKINTAARRVVAYAHHGSLSREIRTEVENRLKEGKLEAIVATSSLEMGIDIGALDEVVLVQSPGSIASTIQRIGRAGHQVGVHSRCTIYPTHPQDFIEAAVLSAAVKEKALEPIRTIKNPLDVLGQIIISMTGTETWDIDELYAEIRRSMSYHHLTRQEFDLVINMLLGRYADHHIRELKPRIRVDRLNNKIEALKGALLSLYLSGGVIPDRGYFQLRHEKDNARIGELDEEFVWEANIGQVFSLGTQTWQVKKITHNDVIVGPAKPGASAPPFWKAEPINRSFHYSERINHFLESANDAVENDDFHQQLIEEFATDTRVATEIVTFLKRQKKHCGVDLPHRHHVVFERIKSGPGRSAGQQMVIHTGWGARVNRPLGMALEAAWQSLFGEQPEVFIANESLVLQLPHEISADDLLQMVPAHKLEQLLRQRLEGPGFFGARFRENAGRSLLLSKGKFNERKPLWMSRLQSQKLMRSVLKYEDFPILLETWRTCLQDEFDIENLRWMLSEIESGEIRITEVECRTPSPFAQSVAWDQVNTYMYMTDTPKATKTSNLREDLLQEVVFSAGLRPSITLALVEHFVNQRQRLLPGHRPEDSDDLEDWIKERSLLPISEWQGLIDELSFTVSDNRFLTLKNGQLIVSKDDHLPFKRILDKPEDEDTQQDLEVLTSNWLQYYGPISTSRIASLLGVPEATIITCLDSLVENNSLIRGLLITDDESTYYCDATNYEYLLRLQRARHRPDVQSRPITALTSYMYRWQTRFSNRDNLEQLYETIECLRAMALPAALWETEVFPCRLQGYETRHLDALFQEGDVQWLGLGEKKVTMGFEEDQALLGPAPQGSELIVENHARYDFTGLLDKTGLVSNDLATALWQEVWQTRIANDSIASLRRGIQNDFKVTGAKGVTGRGSRRGAFNRWRGKMPLSGNWYRLPGTDGNHDELDLLEQQELEKDRARLLLGRYGILFRELCGREAASFQWRKLYRAMRLMELSGEVVSGHFFDHIPGPQFMTPHSLRYFQEDSCDQVLFLNAADPISPSGLGLGIHGDHLPRRIASNYLVLHGDQLVLSVAKRGKELRFYVEHDASDIDRYLDVLHHLTHRSFRPIKQLRIETINSEAAVSSPYLACIEDRFNIIRDYKSVVIQRAFQ